MQPLASLICFSILVASVSCLAQQQVAGRVESNNGGASSSASVSPLSWLDDLRNNKQQEERSSYSRFWLPGSFASFFVHNNARAASGEPRESRLSLAGNKRSTMDSLSGFTIGKRSAAAPQAELINFEPIYGRRFGPPNLMPRVFDMRTTPFDILVEPDYSTE